MPNRDTHLKTWWDTLSPDKKKQARKIDPVRADTATARSLLQSAVPLTPDERGALELDGTLPTDVHTYIMRHD